MGGGAIAREAARYKQGRVDLPSREYHKLAPSDGTTIDMRCLVFLVPPQGFEPRTNRL